MNRAPAWLNALADVDADSDNNMDDVGTWFASSGGSQTGDVSNLSALPHIPPIEYAAVDHGPAAGQPLGINAVKVHNFTIVGIGNRNSRGQITVQIGYRKRY
jgi:hypothetical protein